MHRPSEHETEPPHLACGFRLHETAGKVDEGQRRRALEFRDADASPSPGPYFCHGRLSLERAVEAGYAVAIDAPGPRTARRGGPHVFGSKRLGVELSFKRHDPCPIDLPPRGSRETAGEHNRHQRVPVRSIRWRPI